jgi:hypothetical protein
VDSSDSVSSGYCRRDRDHGIVAVQPARHADPGTDSERSRRHHAATKSRSEFRGRIDIHQDAADGTLTFVDDGIGLSAHDAEQFLGTLGIGITGTSQGTRH